MGFIAVDLGTTNIKVSVYDNHVRILNTESTKVNYFRKFDWVEFDADEYYKILSNTIRGCCSGILSDKEEHQIILTGQAESLIVLSHNGMPIRRAISWLDERSKVECTELETVFDNDCVYDITGQVAIIPTWPITKMLWLKKNEPEVFSHAGKYLLIKDYIQYRLTGNYFGEYSIYNFSLYFDIKKKGLWHDILDFVGIRTQQLPELIEPCTNIGRITNQAGKDIGLPTSTTVNVGTLDHFAGMIGTGNITEGIVSESTGTVLSIATFVNTKLGFIPTGIPCHYGPFKNSYVWLSTSESGGANLEWYKTNFLPNVPYSSIEQILQTRKKPGEIIFLPYLTGTNAPDYDENASGVFYGLKMRHDQFDLALAVMEGVAFLMKRNIEKFNMSGLEVKQIISTGGGSQSKVWSQIKADVTGREIAIPVEKEAACLGAAMIGAVEKGIFLSYQEAAEKCVSISEKFIVQTEQPYLKQYRLFTDLLRVLSESIWNAQ